MNIHHSIQAFKAENQTAVTTGTFDGLHHGHLKIIDALKEKAEKLKLESVVLTFHPHPRMVLYPNDENIRLLMTINEKIEHFQKLGIDHLIVHPFTIDFSRTTFVHYIRDLLVNSLKMKCLIVGHDHHFGKNREGTIQNIKDLEELYGFSTEVINALQVQEINVSSTKIRNALVEGDIVKANRFLGYNYSLTGKVIHGNKLGRTLGFPTANIHVKEREKLIPGIGIYAVKVAVGKNSFLGMMNVGPRPTFDDFKSNLEVHIFDFHNDIYEQNITVTFIDKIRDPQKFESTDELKEALAQDKIRALNILNMI